MMIRFLVDMMIILVAVTMLAVIGVGVVMFWYWLACIHPALALVVMTLAFLFGMFA